MVDIKSPLDQEALDRLTLTSTEARSAYREQRISLEVGRTIRRERKRAGLTQSELAARAGLDLDDLSRLETGQHVLNVNIEVLERVARALGREVVIALVDPVAKESGGSESGAGRGINCRWLLARDGVKIASRKNRTAARLTVPL